MENEKVNKIIEEFIRKNLYPTEQERTHISERYNELKSIIPESRFHIFQSGSYARTTATTPVDDLDVICDSVNPSNDVSVLYDILTLAYRLKAKKIKKQNHSIGIYFGEDEEFSIDVVPAKLATSFPKNEFGDYLYELPEFLNRSKKWRTLELYQSNTVLLSDPKWYIKEALKVDLSSNGNFKRAVKFVKKWNYAVSKSSLSSSFQSFKSFHLEEILKSYFIENTELSLTDALIRFYSEWANYLGRPSILDRADQNKTLFIDSYVNDLSQEDRAKIIENLWTAKRLLNSILIQEDEVEIFRILKNIIWDWQIYVPPENIYVPRSASPHFSFTLWKL